MSSESFILLSSQKKRVLEICQERGIPPHEFEWEEVMSRSAFPVSGSVSRLKYKSTKYYFLFDFFLSGDHDDRYSPAKDSLEFSQCHRYWHIRFENVGNWASYLAREIEATQFLQTAMRVPTLECLSELSRDSEGFTVGEQQQLAEKIDLIEAKVLEIPELLAEHKTYIRFQFDQLREESKRASRVSWFQMLLGAFVTIVTACAVDADTARGIWDYTNSQLGSLVSGITRLGQSST